MPFTNSYFHSQFPSILFFISGVLKFEDPLQTIYLMQDSLQTLTGQHLQSIACCLPSFHHRVTQHSWILNFQKDLSVVLILEMTRYFQNSKSSHQAGLIGRGYTKGSYTPLVLVLGLVLKWEVCSEDPMTLFGSLYLEFIFPHTSEELHEWGC